jgi:hypothetical protein
LCQRWGFYFVAQRDKGDIGSDDLEKIMRELDKSTGYEKAKTTMKGSDQGPEATETAAKHIREVVERRLAQLLLARCLLLGLLVEEAQKEMLKLKEHRRLWVLLQVQPCIFEIEHGDDVFMRLTRLLQSVAITELKAQISQQLENLHEVLKEKIICVLDEVQVTVSPQLGRLDEFLAGDNKTRRPILREIWLAWSAEPYMNLVLSGTGIDRQALENTLSSAACKRYPWTTVHDIGAFNDHETQGQYIRRYVPMPPNDPKWVEFLTRAWAWFHGR